MSITKTQRPKKRQFGQFMTPPVLTRATLDYLSFRLSDKILEPSMGDGSFIITLIEKFLPLYDGDINHRLDRILNNNIYGVEIDPELYHQCLLNIQKTWGYLPECHNLVQGDFFLSHFTTKGYDSGLYPSQKEPILFNYIIGNPPFGGTIEPSIQDKLDGLYGFRNGEKIKKETYSFFIVKSLDMLSQSGKILFICSDTFLTIATMRGLRRLLMAQGNVIIKDLTKFSEETSHPMVLLYFEKNGYSDRICINGNPVSRTTIELAENFSWRITEELSKYFGGPTLGNYMIATSGMTVGKNEYFLRKIQDGHILEDYDFEFFQEPITLTNELQRARLGFLSPQKINKIKALESAKATRTNVSIVKRSTPIKIKLPHPDYCYYNKAVKDIIYSATTHVIFWKDNGKAVLTFKKAGKWYLHGVGGQPFFKKEGITWHLIAQKFYMRYLPSGYILDSGAPSAFLRPGVPKDELYFILAWTLTPLCNFLLKEVINHTKNIQGKDFERLPYPFWVSSEIKQNVAQHMKRLLGLAMQGKKFTYNSPELQSISEQFNYPAEEVSGNRTYQMNLI